MTTEEKESTPEEIRKKREEKENQERKNCAEI